ncbi:hypothetical protein ACVBGC_20755 [Burkholderia stagnalis]
MTPSPLVPVEGLLGRPRVAPLDNVPPFGREWAVRGGSDTRPGRAGVAVLSTTCIDVDAPHRACRWQPLATTEGGSLAARLPVISASTAVSGEQPGRSRRRALAAACWSFGALGIIGGLIVAHEPGLDSAPADGMLASTGSVQIAAIQPEQPPPSSLSARPTATRPIASTAGSSPVSRGVMPRRTASPAAATSRSSDTPRVATAPPSHRTIAARTTTAPVRQPARPLTTRVAARPPVVRDAASTPPRHRSGTAPHAIGMRDALDDPLTLIAMASALRAAEPATARPAPAPGFDWTAHLSQRRLTDTPDAFAH